MALGVCNGRGATFVAEAAGTPGLPVVAVDAVQERCLAAAEHALQSRPKDDEAVNDAQITKRQATGGEQRAMVRGRHAHRLRQRRLGAARGRVQSLWAAQEFMKASTSAQSGMIDRFIRRLTEAYGRTASRASSGRGARRVEGSPGTTTSVRIQHAAIAARASAGNDNFTVWLDWGGTTRLDLIAPRAWPTRARSGTATVHWIAEASTTGSAGTRASTC